MSTWVRHHRDDSVTARVAHVPNGVGLYVSYTMGTNGLVSELVDGEDAHALAKAAADRASDCPRPCVCPPRVEIPHRTLVPAK